jgi:hypothetical protein
MTPFARDILSRKTLPKEYREALELSVCFDMSHVADLTYEIKHTFEDNWNEFHLHGGLAVMPNDACWFEIRDKANDAKYGWLCLVTVINKDEISITVRTFEEISGGYESISGIIHVKDDFVKILKHAGTKFPLTDNTDVQYYSLSSVIAFMLIINAPYGIKHETPPRHKGHLREARRQGFELLPHHIIKLDRSAPPKEYEAKGKQGSPKAFHFVRSHLRHYTNGDKTVVKAHWRGDPRLGIHRASYSVR